MVALLVTASPVPEPFAEIGPDAVTVARVEDPAAPIVPFTVRLPTVALLVTDRPVPPAVACNATLWNVQQRLLTESRVAYL